MCKNKDNFWYKFCAGALILLAVYVVYWCLIGMGIDDFEERGTFGDSFGAINSFFTGLAFVGLLITIHMQRKDLNDQRNDALRQFEYTERQTRAAERMNFESIFYRILDDLTEKAERVEYNVSGQKYLGHAAFEKWYEEFFKYQYDPELKLKQIFTFSDGSKFVQPYLYWDLGKDNFQVYLQVLEELLLHFATSDVEWKRSYLKRVVREMSSEGVAIVFYAAAAKGGELKDLLIETKFFADIDFTSLLEYEHALIYPEKIYNGRFEDFMNTVSELRMQQYEDMENFITAKTPE